MRTLRSADYLAMPWKNGGGSTTQLAVAPQGAGLDDFEWRISTARVEAAGPFSCFSGVDRSLALLQGSGILLEPEDGQPRMLTTQSEPFAFPGEQIIVARLADGPVTDFNVMTRRASWKHSLQTWRLSGTAACPRRSDLMFIYCAQGQPTLVRCANGQEAVCAAGNAVLIDHSDGDQVELSAAEASLCIARLTFKGTPDVE